MKKNSTLPQAILCFFLFLSVSAAAQQPDSSRYDVGFGTLNKNFTQHVTVRGEDLQKMPFVNLSDAIRAWFFGAYTGLLTYVVDGNPVMDVNIYPIYDIEEVTWIENAVASAAHGNTETELVLVTTKRGRAKPGLQVAAQTGLVKEDAQGTPTNSGVYHQYYAGAAGNFGKVSAGVSADWQQDIFPEAKAQPGGSDGPAKLQRWRLNGWLDWRPDAQNRIGLRLGYAPQQTKNVSAEAGANSYSYFSTGQNYHFFVPELSWEGNWAPGLRNRLDAEYLHSPYSYQNNESAVYPSGTGTVNSSNGESENYTANHVFIRDHLNYETKAGNWTILPAIDLDYQHIDEKSSEYNFQQGPNAFTNTFSEESKGSLFYITPAVDLELAKALDIDAGMLIDASSKVDPSNRRFFPFVTAGLDVLHLGNSAEGAGLKVFGSYARRPAVFINDYGLDDLANTGATQSLFNVFYGASGYTEVNGNASLSNFAGKLPGAWTWETGLEFVSQDRRLTVQYSYERRSLYPTLINVTTGSGYEFEPWTASFHHVNARVTVVDSKAVKWVTGLDVNLLRLKGDTAGSGAFYANIGNDLTGDVYPAGYSWTGGWVNRLTLGHFTAGLDLLYHLGLSTNTGYPKNTMAMPNVYAGYNFGLPHERALEVFVESRGLVMNTRTDLIDPRRYYTVGGNLTL
jgi:hypothetical protein